MFMKSIVSIFFISSFCMANDSLIQSNQLEVEKNDKLLSESSFECPKESKLVTREETNLKTQWCENLSGVKVGSEVEIRDGLLRKIIPIKDGKYNGIGKEVHFNGIDFDPHGYDDKYFKNDTEVSKEEFYKKVVTETVEIKPIVNLLGQKCPEGTWLDKVNHGVYGKFEICKKDNLNEGPYIEIFPNGLIRLMWYKNDLNIKVSESEELKAKAYNENIAKQNGIKVGLTPWPNKSEIIGVKGDIVGVGTFEKLDRELVHWPKNYIVIDNGLNGKWVIHLPPDIFERLNRRGLSIDMKCEAGFIRTNIDESKAVHCKFKNLIGQ